MASWNICRFAETLLPLIDEDMDRAIDLAQKVINKFTDLYFENWISIMRAKLGLFNEEIMDKAIIARFTKYDGKIQRRLYKYFCIIDL